MAADPFSPVAPVRLRALLLPIGKIKRSRFLAFARRLQAQNVVRLKDVSPDGRMNKNTFSPLAFPPGMIIYDLSISVPPTNHLETFPFEIFRESLVILAIADGTELSNLAVAADASSDGKPAFAGNLPRPAGLEDLVEQLAMLKDGYPRSLVQQLLIFDYEGVETPLTDPEGITWVPSPEKSRSTTIKTVMCDITALLLRQLASFTESMEGWSTVESPKASSWGPRRTLDTRPIDKLQHRMTMPAQLPSRPNGLPKSAPDTPSNLVGHDSPTTFDEITRSIQLANRAETLKSASKPGSKEHSRERKTGQSIGSLSTTDRANARVSGRLKVVVGTLYLQAGIWPDAIKELVEGATVTRAGSDYIWHAKALESIILCLLMLGWAGMDFQIPQICYPAVDKSSLKPASGAETYTSGRPNFESHVASLRSLAKLLPDVSAHILNLYTRATNITDEPLPQVLFSETVIRLARLLSIIYARDGFLDDEGLQHIVSSKPLTTNNCAHRPKGDMTLSKTEITSFLFRALPSSPTSDIPVTDSVPILAGMASVLSILGLDRKRAFILKEMVSVLIPGLVQARKIGAAEMGIHPAAGLMALNNTTFDINALDVGSGNLEESLRSLLSSLGDTYGVQGTRYETANNDFSNGEESPDDSFEAIVSRALRYAALRTYGDLSLKTDILKSCINLCEALPDFQGVLQFTVDLLRTIKGSVMLSTGMNQAVPALGQDEQVRLYNNVKRTVGAAHILGVPNLEAEYWDDFLVRGIDFVPMPEAQVPIRRSRKAEDTSEKSPFIYNAFAKTTPSRSEAILIAGEYNELKVTLQNPFEFDVEIESLRLDGEGVPFQAVVEGFSLAPFSLQEKIVPVLPASEGILKITGCIVKVRYCRERRFPTFRKYWKPEVESKLKRMGLAAKVPLSERPISWGSREFSGKPEVATTGPESESLVINVIKEQPMVVLDSTSLSQFAVMILEGETKSFDITLHNVSRCPVDLVHFTFQDSTTQQLQTALQNKDTLPADLYELELQLVTKPVLRWSRPEGEDGPVSIPPGAKSTFTIEIFGKRGLYDAQVQIDYGHLGISQSDLPEHFYVRQITMPLTVTVNASVEVVRCDIYPLTGDFPWSRRQNPKPTGKDKLSSENSLSTKSLSQTRESKRPNMISRSCKVLPDNGHCLLLLDIRNHWPNPLSISIFQDETWESVHEENDGDCKYVPKDEVTDVIQPGHISRVALIIPRIFIENPRRPIPSLNSGFRRQFVVSSHKLSYEVEVSTREAFWYREEILKHLGGTWKDEFSRRRGQIELRNIHLNDRMIETLRIEEVDVRFTLESINEGDDSIDSQGSTTVDQIGQFKYSVRTNSFLRLRVSIVNRSLRPIQPLLRLQPSLRNQPHAIALELSKRMAWTGMLQRSLPVLGPGKTAEATLGLTVFCRGEYEIGATVEEVRVLALQSFVNPDGEGADGSISNQAFIDPPDTFQEALEKNAAKQRRIWHSRNPCTIFAQD
ncbi:hypothetical protein VTO42DRAFT_3583 [Malbranchea cinnamomea]